MPPGTSSMHILILQGVWREQFWLVQTQILNSLTKAIQGFCILTLYPVTLLNYFLCSFAVVDSLQYPLYMFMSDVHMDNFINYFPIFISLIYFLPPSYTALETPIRCRSGGNCDLALLPVLGESIQIFTIIHVHHEFFTCAF